MPVFEDTDPEIVALPMLTIEESRVPRDLEQDIARQYQRMKSTQLSWKGGPLYTKDFGRVRLGVYSVLYVPVMIGFSW